MPKPENEAQYLVHLADYLASRKCLTMEFDKPLLTTVELPDVDEYVIDFGKHNGTKLVDLFRTKRDYCNWLKENVQREPVISLIKVLEEREKQQGEDEI